MTSKDIITRMSLNFGLYKKNLIKLSKTRHFRYGVPFILFVVGASFGLKYFTNLRYKYRSVVTFRDEAKKREIPVKPPEEVGTLETHYEEMKKLDIDNWENVRIPRPWEPKKEKK